LPDFHKYFYASKNKKSRPFGTAFVEVTCWFDLAVYHDLPDYPVVAILKNDRVDT